MTAMAFSIRRVAPSRRWVYQHVFCYQSTAMKSAESRRRRVAFIGIFFAISRRRWLFQSGQTRLRHAAFIGIFFAIDRPNMRWILVEIRSPDPKFFFVRVDPFPQDFTPRASVRTRVALHAHEVGRKPMAIATAAAPTMV